MKIGKQELKALIKECLVELLAEGLGSNLIESVKAAPRHVTPPTGTRNRDVEPLPNASRRTLPPQAVRHATLDERVTPRNTAVTRTVIPPAVQAITRDPIMAAIFADTAQTTLVEQARGTMPGDVASQAAARVAPEQMFDEATIDKWNQAAFRADRPGPTGLPADFIHDLLKGD